MQDVPFEVRPPQPAPKEKKWTNEANALWIYYGIWLGRHPWAIKFMLERKYGYTHFTEEDIRYRIYTKAMRHHLVRTHEIPAGA